MPKKEFKTLWLTYEPTFNGHFADKPILNGEEEQCLCITHKKVFICDVFDEVKPNNIKIDYLIFELLEDRNIWVSLDLFLLDDDYRVNLKHNFKPGTGHWGWQMALIDKGNHYEIDYQDGFITGDIRGGDDFQQLTSDWQW